MAKLLYCLRLSPSTLRFLFEFGKSVLNENAIFRSVGSICSVFKPLVLLLEMLHWFTCLLLSDLEELTPPAGHRFTMDIVA